MQRLNKTITDLTSKTAQISEKVFDSLLDRMYFIGNDGHQHFLVFAPMLISLMLDGNEKVTDWILTRISSEKIKPLDTNLETTMSNLANCRVIL